MTPGADSGKCFLPTPWGPWGRGRAGGQGQSIGLLPQGPGGLTTLARASGSSRATGHHRTVDRKRGHARFLSSPPTLPPCRSCSFAPLEPGSAPALKTPEVRSVFLFPACGCSAGNDHQRTGCAQCSMEQLEQGGHTQGSFWACPCRDLKLHLLL